MSLTENTETRDLDGFPRVSGDEPGSRIVAPGLTTFSPRERG